MSTWIWIIFIVMAVFTVLGFVIPILDFMAKALDANKDLRKARVAREWAATAERETEIYGAPLHDTEGNFLGYPAHHGK